MEEMERSVLVVSHGCLVDITYSREGLGFECGNAVSTKPRSRARSANKPAQSSGMDRIGRYNKCISNEFEECWDDAAI